MKRVALALLVAASLLGSAAGASSSAQPAANAEAATRSPAGIPLDSEWRRKVYAHAREKLQHPAWGWRHSERDYLLAVSIAQAERLTIDHDILFAAAFLHDAGAIAPFAKNGVDHAERSAELAEPFLQDAGFPMEKFPAVRSAILSHMFDKNPSGPEAVVLHDADTVDFLGATGIARRLSVTGSAVDMDGGMARAELFASELPSRLVTRAARRMGRDRVETMKDFFEQLKRETPVGATL